jgi:hypothetical protein
MSECFGGRGLKSVRVFCGLTVCLLSTACATAPDKVKAAYVSPTAYSAWSCEQLGAESQKVSTALAKDTARQKRTRIVDGVGLALVLLPLGSLTGGDHTRDLGELAGKQNALWRAEADQSCISDAKGDFHASFSSKTQGAEKGAAPGAS